jgi:hypothetical protein
MLLNIYCKLLNDNKYYLMPICIVKQHTYHKYVSHGANTI